MVPAAGVREGAGRRRRSGTPPSEPDRLGVRREGVAGETACGAIGDRYHRPEPLGRLCHAPLPSLPSRGARTNSVRPGREHREIILAGRGGPRTPHARRLTSPGACGTARKRGPASLPTGSAGVLLPATAIHSSQVLVRRPTTRPPPWARKGGRPGVRARRRAGTGGPGRAPPNQRTRRAPPS